jgi:hypothetical protein
MVTEKSSRSFLTIFFSIRLRVRGIRCNYPLTYWKGYEPRVDFPDKLLSNDKFIEVIPKDMKWNYIFVEPGVEQDQISNLNSIRVPFYMCKRHVLI